MKLIWVSLLSATLLACGPSTLLGDATPVPTRPNERTPLLPPITSSVPPRENVMHRNEVNPVRSNNIRPFWHVSVRDWARRATEWDNLNDSCIGGFIRGWIGAGCAGGCIEGAVGCSAGGLCGPVYGDLLCDVADNVKRFFESLVSANPTDEDGFSLGYTTGLAGYPGDIY